MTPDPETAPLPGFTEDTETMPAVPETEVLPDLPEASFAGASLAGQPAPFTYPTFGDYFAVNLPGFDIWPCGRCGAVFTGYDAALLCQDRVLRPMVHLARDEGWGPDSYGIWCCPPCAAASEPPVQDDDDGAIAALRAHHHLLAVYDHAAEELMGKLGGEWRPRKWSFREPGEDGWWRDEEPAAGGEAAA
jgi:hypothetical protein